MLRLIREKADISISELSKMSGITRQTIYRLENEEDAAASTKTLKALADALDVKVSDFFSS
jgi:transcriptional regulator with XRE-family HTH domain